jgi:hypothetical protein
MELIMMSLGGSLVVLSVQFSEFVVAVGTRVRTFGRRFTRRADPEMVIPGC